MGSGKARKSNYSTRINVIKATVITVILLCVAGYFVYITGLLPKLFTGIVINETAADGTVTQVESFTVLETNYHFNEVFNTFAMYGYVSPDNLDTVIDETTGATVRSFILEQAAEEMMNSYLVNRVAEEGGYLEFSGAQRYAELQLESLKETAKNYNYQTPDQYLQVVYGTGMTQRAYKDFVAKETLTGEYEQYVRQFVFAASQEDIQNAYDTNPSAYDKVDFNYYFFPGETDESGKVTSIVEAESNARAILAKHPTDSDSFLAATKSVLTSTNNTDALTAFENAGEDQNPTEYIGYNSGISAYLPDEMISFLFETAQPGQTTVISTEDGAYVVFLADRYVDDETTVTYRTLTLNNDVASDPNATPEEVAAGIDALQNQVVDILANVTDSLSFATAVKMNSKSSNEIITGGYVSGETEADYVDGSQSQIDLKDWLFDESRVAGETYVLVADDNSKITIYYFEEQIPSWMNSARELIITSLVNGWSDDLKKNNPTYDIKYDTIVRLTY